MRLEIGEKNGDGLKLAISKKNTTNVFEFRQQEDFQANLHLK